MHYWTCKTEREKLSGPVEITSQTGEIGPLQRSRKWVLVGTKGTGIRSVSQRSAPMSYSHAWQHKLNRLYLKDELAGEQISCLVQRRAVSQPHSSLLSSHLWRPLALSWNLTVAALYMQSGGLTGIPPPFKVIWTKSVAESDNAFPGTLQPSLWWEML